MSLIAVPLSPKMKLKSTIEIKEEILKKFFTKRYHLPTHANEANGHVTAIHGQHIQFAPIEPAISNGNPKASVVGSHQDYNRSHAHKGTNLKFMVGLVQGYMFI